MALSQPNFGHDLYRILPAVYRNRDKSGDLGAFLGACGSLLDRIHQTVVQNLADQFPDNPDGGSAGPDAGLGCQDWLLPYFAKLLDVRLVSPLVEGRRDEISNAISWRQRKGTLAVIEQVVEAISQQEAAIQEGWKRVATTPRPGNVLLPATTFGYDREPDAGIMDRHPGLPAVTPDVRCPSGAVDASAVNPAAQTATIDAVDRRWRQSSLHGAPCHPGSHADVSRRTVDFREPDWRVGHYHPRRVLLHLPPPAGLVGGRRFVEGLGGDRVVVNWSPDSPSENFQAHIETDQSDPHCTVYRNRTIGTDDFRTVCIQHNIALASPASAAHTFRFEGLVLVNTVTVAPDCRIELAQTAVHKLVLETAASELPVLDAVDSLIGSLETASGLVRLEYCTVLGPAICAAVQASDCIFQQELAAPSPAGSGGSSSAPAAVSGCVRYSRLAPGQDTSGLSTRAVTTLPATFFAADINAPERSTGVLHPATSDAICHGAEDGGEMGAHHHQFHCQIRAAIAEKLHDFLPLGIEAVLIPDPQLANAPEIAAS